MFRPLIAFTTLAAHPTPDVPDAPWLSTRAKAEAWAVDKIEMLKQVYPHANFWFSVYNNIEDLHPPSRAETLKLTFDPQSAEECEVVQDLLKGRAALDTIFEIRQRVFRPARKHGYTDPEVQGLLDKINALAPEEGLGEALVWELERLFNAVLEEHGVSEHS